MVARTERDLNKKFIGPICRLFRQPLYIITENSGYLTTIEIVA